MSDYQADVVKVQAALDQYVASCRPMLRSLADFGAAAIEEGCSPAVADALSLRVANSLLGELFGPGIPS